MEPLDRDALRRYARVTVMGLGLFGGGAGAARYFAGLGAAVTVTDAASAEKLARSVAALDGLGIRFVLGRHDETDFTETDLVIANQAVRPENPFLAAARRAGVPVATETGLALALNRSPWIGVTGSSGKSTTASLLAAILVRHDPDSLFGGNIGGSLLPRVDGRSAVSPLTAELSSFQLTWLRDGLESGGVAPARVAVVTNLAPNHLDWHRDMDEYVEAKANLLRWQTRDDWAVLNADDGRLATWAETMPARTVRCGMADPGTADACFVDSGAIILRLGGRVVLTQPLNRFRLYGRHNLYNAAQAVAAAYVFFRDADAIDGALAEFPGLPHRLERVGEVAGRTFVNDSKSTTPEAAVTALDAVPGPVVLIAGGYDKRSPFDALAAAVQAKAAGLVLVGAAGKRLGDAVADAAGARPTGMATLAVVDAGDDFEKAVRAARDLTPEGGTVLLSPACASYGMFVNYEERGDVFRRLAADGEA